MSYEPVMDEAATEVRNGHENILLMDILDKSVLQAAAVLNFKPINPCEVQTIVTNHQPNGYGYQTDLTTAKTDDLKVNPSNINHKRKKKPRKRSVSDGLNEVPFPTAKNIQSESKIGPFIGKTMGGKSSRDRKVKKAMEVQTIRHKLILPKEVLPKVQPTQHCYPIVVMKIEEDPKPLPEYTEHTQAPILTHFEKEKKDDSSIESKLKFFKCYACPFVTLSKDMLSYHLEKKDKCFESSPVYGCPGCYNAFLSLTSLRVHLVHDHRMPVKEVRLVLQNLNEQPNLESDKSSCAFGGSAGSSQLLMNGDGFSLAPLEQEAGSELGGCSSGKRPTMLESYLDDISNKAECNLPPPLSQTGSDLLENTFNFTAPVSEQLPAIQPPPTNTPLPQPDHSLLQETHSFLNMANVFSEDREQVQYKEPEDPHYPQHLLTGNSFLDSEIPEITLECQAGVGVKPVLDNKADLHSTEPFDFPSYGADDADECRMSDGDDHRVEDDEEDKKRLKKLSVGFRCDINGCKVRLQSEKKIQYHRRCHEGTLYNCPECCKDCATWVALSSHLWQAHKIDMELYKCDQCPYKTPSYSRLTNIHRGIHGTTRPYLCDTCGKGFKTVKQMRNHKNTHKAKMVRMASCRCHICGRTMADKRLLDLHVKNTHEKKKPYLCYICGYASAVKHTLVVHMRRHTGEKPYKCDKCDYQTADHNALRRHKMKHTGQRNYKCSRCSYTCIQATTYRAHVKTKHPGLETDVIFSCDQCNFQTINRGSFQLHISEHSSLGARRHPSTTVPTVHGGHAGPYAAHLVEPIITSRVVDSIVDLSGPHTLLEDDLYEVEHITGDLGEPMLED